MRSVGIELQRLIDTWIEVSNTEREGERNRGINVLKSRGVGHSNQVREFLITSGGIEIRDVYTGERGVLMGSARRSQEARERPEHQFERDRVALAEGRRNRGAQSERVTR